QFVRIIESFNYIIIILFLQVRRPGCQLCREEAVRISSRRDLISGKMGLNMVAIIHENLDNEVEEFNKDFWKGTVYFDKEKAFYSALGYIYPNNLIVQFKGNFFFLLINFI